MPMQAKAEGVKLFHAKAQLWALLGFVLMLLWFANSGTMYFMVEGDLLNPLDSIGFFKDVAMGKWAVRLAAGAQLSEPDSVQLADPRQSVCGAIRVGAPGTHR